MYGERLDGDYTRMPRPILYKSWRQHPTKQLGYIHPYQSRKLSKLDESDRLDTGGDVRTNSYVTYPSGPLYMDKQRRDDQLEPIYNTCVTIQDVA